MQECQPPLPPASLIVEVQLGKRHQKQEISISNYHNAPAVELEIRRFIAMHRLKPAAFDHIRGLINAAIYQQETFLFSSNFTVPSQVEHQPRFRVDDLFNSGFDSAKPLSMNFGTNPQHQKSGMFGATLPLEVSMHSLRPKMPLKQHQSNLAKTSHSPSPGKKALTTRQRKQALISPRNRRGEPYEHSSTPVRSQTFHILNADELYDMVSSEYKSQCSQRGISRVL